MQLEMSAPPADALKLNGEWKLVAACGESAYRSSPFFWAFRQACAGYNTPVGIPGGNVPAGGTLAQAVYAITDSIPFYDIGPVTQRIEGLCDEDAGCEIPEDEESSDGVGGEGEPNDGSMTPPPSGIGQLTSEVELCIGRNFGLPVAKSQMTTTSTITARPALPGGTVVEAEVRIEQTQARQSSIAALLPQLDDALKFPSGDALEALRPTSATVLMRTTYVTDTLRISRPKLQDGIELDPAARDAIFVYTRA